MDIASSLAQKPVNIPQINVAPMGALEQQGITQSGITGVGQPTVGSAVSGVQGAMAPVGAQQISQFLNPYQQYVTNEIGRQGQMMAQQVGANAIQAGAFGGGREGVQQAELQGRTLSAMGQAQAQGFQTALQASQTQRQQQLAGGQMLGQLGAQQQAMSLADINAQMQAGAVQRGIGQRALDAQRATELQRAYEPYQRVEFMKGIMTNLPTTTDLFRTIGEDSTLVDVIRNEGAELADSQAIYNSTVETLLSKLSDRDKNIIKLIFGIDGQMLNMDEIAEKYNMNKSEVWTGIVTNRGSVQHLQFLTDEEKEVFKTAVELDQIRLIELAGQISLPT